MFIFSTDLNAKNVQLPDLIKETNNLKDLEIKPPPISKSSVSEEKLSPCVSKSVTSPNAPDIASPKTETPTPTVETKNFELAPLRINGETCVRLEKSPLNSPLRENVSLDDWSRKNEKTVEKEKNSEESDEIDSDSLSSSDLDDDDEIEEDNNLKTPIISVSPPRLHIRSNNSNLLNKERIEKIEDSTNFEPDSIECSNLLDDVRDLECKEKELDAVNNGLKQLQIAQEARSVSPTSSRNSTTEENDVTTAAYTETEFSEWARDGHDLVSEDLRDVEYDMNPEFQGKGKRPSLQAKPLANGEEDLTDIELDYSQEERQSLHPIASKLLANGEDIGFMDTDNDSLLEEDSLRESSRQKNRGYIEFVSVKNSPVKRPNEAPIAKVEHEYEDSSEAQTPCCEDNVIEFNPVTMDDVRHRLKPPAEIQVTECGNVDAVNKDMMSLSMEEDSLLIVEPAEDTTTSEVVTVLVSPRDPVKSIVKERDTEDDTPSDPTKTSEIGTILKTMKLKVN